MSIFSASSKARWFKATVVKSGNKAIDLMKSPGENPSLFTRKKENGDVLIFCGSHYKRAKTLSVEEARNHLVICGPVPEKRNEEITYQLDWSLDS